MPFQTLSIHDIEKRFDETLAKELNKPRSKNKPLLNVKDDDNTVVKDLREKLIARIPDEDRRRQFLLLLRTINKFKVYPSNIPKITKQELASAALLNVKAEIFDIYDKSLLNKFGFGMLGLVDPNNSVLYSDIDYIIGVSKENPLDEQSKKSFEHIYKKYNYLEQNQITEPYYASELSGYVKSIKNPSINLRSVRMEEKGVDVFDKKIKQNYLTVENAQLKDGRTPHNSRITDIHDRRHYLAKTPRSYTFKKKVSDDEKLTSIDLQGKSYFENGSLVDNRMKYKIEGDQLFEVRRVIYDSELEAYDSYMQISKMLMDEIRHKTSAAPAANKSKDTHPTPAAVSDPDAIVMREQKAIQDKKDKRYVVFDKNNQAKLPNKQDAKNISFDDDTLNAAKANYFKKINESVLTFKRSTLKKLPTDVLAEQSKLENSRLGRK